MQKVEENRHSNITIYDKAGLYVAKNETLRKSANTPSHDPWHLDIVVPPLSNTMRRKERGGVNACDITHNIIVSCAKSMSNMKEKIGV